MSPRLSKSRVQSGRQCHKRLWLELHERESAYWDATGQARLVEGTRFGEIARTLLGKGLLIERDHLHVSDALAQTDEVLRRPRTEAPLLFEPAFSHQDVYVRVDALRRGPAGDTLIEVKSTASAKDEHIWDCAIQTWVARGAGRPVRKICVAHANPDFVYSIPGNYRGLLQVVDVTARVEALQDQIAGVVATLKQVASGPMPNIRTGAHCAEPYACPFHERCRAEEPAPAEFPIELLPRAGKLLEKLRVAGYRDIRDIPPKVLRSETHRKIAKATRTNKRYLSAAMREAIKAIGYPRCFLDFETASFVVPRWLGTRPFQPLPFQFSCHHEVAPGKIRHADFLDLSGDSPLRDFVDRLLDVLSEDGPILVWNRVFEATRLKELAAMFPSRRRALLKLTNRMVDLLRVYRKHYYHRDMRGSWSIKAVLPTVAPELAYDDLDIAGGMDAQAAYMEAIDAGTALERRQELEKSLRAYCQRDTHAMIRLMKPWAKGGTRAST